MRPLSLEPVGCVTDSLFKYAALNRTSVRSVFQMNRNKTNDAVLPLTWLVWGGKKIKVSKRGVLNADGYFFAWTGLFYADIFTACPYVRHTMQHLWAVTESKSSVSDAAHSPVAQIFYMRNVVQKRKKRKPLLMYLHTRSAGQRLKNGEEQFFICPNDFH